MLGTRRSACLGTVHSQVLVGLMSLSKCVGVPTSERQAFSKPCSGPPGFGPGASRRCVLRLLRWTPRPTMDSQAFDGLPGLRWTDRPGPASPKPGSPNQPRHSSSPLTPGCISLFNLS